MTQAANLAAVGSTATSTGKTAYPGAVLQVVQNTYSTYVSTNSSTASSTGLTATITPSSSTSKILVFVNGVGGGTNANTTAAEYSIYKNGSSLFVFDRLNHYTNAGTSVYGPVVTTYLDSPATTSALTYALYFRVYSGGGYAYLNNYASGNTSISTMTLLEIAG